MPSLRNRRLKISAAELQLTDSFMHKHDELVKERLELAGTAGCIGLPHIPAMLSYVGYTNIFIPPFKACSFRIRQALGCCKFWADVLTKYGPTGAK